jgi:hypothetical protein
MISALRNLGVHVPLQVSHCTIALPGKPAVNISLYSTSNVASVAAGATAPGAINVINIQAADMEVVVSAPASNTTGTNTVVDLTKIVDTTPPVITMVGDSYLPVLQAERFTDPGVRVYDNVDGNIISAIARLQLCARPAGELRAIPANDTKALARCGLQLASVSTTLLSRDNETHVVTYTARDAAGNRAVPLRRFVLVTARYDAACWRTSHSQHHTTPPSDKHRAVRVSACKAAFFAAHAGGTI